MFIKSIKLRMDFSFVLVLSFAFLFGYKNGLLLLIFSVSHELGHLAALLAFKTKISEITLSFFGFGIKYEKLLSIKQEATVLLCGPAVNLLLFLFFKDDINLILLILNVIPIFPLDGGRLLLLLLPDFGRYVSTVFLIILFAISLYLLIGVRVYSLLLVTVYLLIFNLRYL